MNFLAEIVAHKLKESLELFESGKLEAFKEAIARRPQPLSLKKALDEAPGRAIIAEIKRASPSKGELAMSADPVDLARVYEENGAAAISVLTERAFFHGEPGISPGNQGGGGGTSAAQGLYPGAGPGV